MELRSNGLTSSETGYGSRRTKRCVCLNRAKAGARQVRSFIK
ncbi:hypothetical protein A2U01_0034589, partial [Trifolium medium]|nr:hypothetical protein [Trifolium medium]